MPLPALLLPLLAAASQAPDAPERPIVVTGHGGPPFISPMGQAFRPRSAGEDTLAKWFHRADTNADGVLTPDEMRADADRFFATLDTDHDGKIDPDELVRYEWDIAPEIQVASKFRRAHAPAEAEADLDPDAEHRHGRREGDDRMTGGLQGGARYALLNIPEPVAAADADFDRAITLNEFRQAAGARFLLLDTGHLGRLSLAQLESMRPIDPTTGRPVKRSEKAADTRYGLPLPPGN